MEKNHLDEKIVDIVNTSPHPLPAYASEGAAGLDLRAHLSKPCLLAPLQRVLIPTGLHIALPPGYEAQLRPRSGLAFQQGLTLLNSPGTIDADYRGEIKVLLVNLSDKSVHITDGTRIAQLVLATHSRITWQPVQQLTTSERASGGFGSTGLT